MKTIRDIDVKNKTVLVRVDFNVPLENGEVTDNFRILSALPTLQYLRENGAAKIILISHLGRPEGVDPALSLMPASKELSKHLDHVKFIDATFGEKVQTAVQDLKPGEILLLENLRFYPGEEANSADFIKQIIDATGAEIFVQDGFAVAHRAHASTVAVADFLPVYAGLLLEKEIDNLSKILQNPEHPVLLILGGAKVADKTPLIEKFLPIADKIFVGGKIAADFGPELAKFQQENPAKIYIAEDFDENGAGDKLDVGPLATVELAKEIDNAKTIIWNGLLGKAEDPAYSTASTIAAKLIGESADKTTVILGGDTTGFVSELIKENDNLDYSLLSTGGGASLSYLSGEKMPALEVIK